MERLSRFGRKIEKARKDFLKYYQKKCPTLFRICFDPIGTHRGTRAFIGFLLGFVAAVSLYEGIIVNLEFDMYTSLALGAILIVMLSIGCAISMQIRCICLLSIPTFLGRSGCTVLRMIIVGFIITGPISNLMSNSKEVVKTFACTTYLTYNLTKTRFDLMFKPFQQAILAMKDEGANDLKDTVSSIRDLMSPIVEEIEGEKEMMRLKEENDYLDKLQDDMKRSDEIEQKHDRLIAQALSEADVYEAKYLKKIEARCEEQLSRGAERCRDIFNGAHDKCKKKVSALASWLLCWPMKLNFVCNMAHALGGSDICTSKGKIDSGIGEGYAALKRARDTFGKSVKDAKLQYRLKKLPVKLDIHDATNAAKTIIHEFSMRKNIIESVIMIVKRCLSFIFLRIIINAQNYHNKYISDIEFDNIYVTSYFRKIDARRKVRGSLTLLPLKKIERIKFVDPYSPRPGKAERMNLFSQTVRLILEMIGLTTFLLLDRLLYEALNLVKKHAYMEYTQMGHHDLSLEIRGAGMIATLIRKIVRGFNVKRRVKTVVTNEACLPKPSKLPVYVSIKIYLIYAIIWVLLYTSIYTQRMRRVICSFFYTKREKRRVLYLYNETLRRRLGYARFLRARVKSLVRSGRLEYDMNPWLALRLRWPVLCGWLAFFAWARYKCLVCNEVEPFRGPQFRRCTTPGCPFVHCPECWIDVGQICYACADIEETDDDTDEYTI